MAGQRVASTRESFSHPAPGRAGPISGSSSPTGGAAGGLESRIRVAELLADQGHDARQGPERGGISQGFLRPALQIGGQFDAIQRSEAGSAPHLPGVFEELAAAGFPRLVPASGGFVADVKTPDDFSLGAALREKFGRAHTSPLQVGKVSFYTFGIAHISFDADTV